MSDVIRTKRLMLVPMSREFMRLSLDGNICEAEQQIGASLPAAWPGEHQRLLSVRLAQLEADPMLEVWLVRAVVLRDERVMIGHIGFHTGPASEYLEPYSPGGVEVGFTVYPSYRRDGYAREACVGLFRWAADEQGVEKFVMTIQPSNVPSLALAASLGFVRVGSHIDEVDGVEDIFECERKDLNLSA
jgi:RimJ/RimL family protein N-acetyltransferase